MKKAFSLMEVIIAISILSFVMVTLLQIKSENIFLISKSEEISKNSEYLLAAINLNEVNQRNENLFLDRNYSFDNDDLRKEFKDKKIKIKDEKLKTDTIDNDYMKLNLTTYTTTYKLDNSNSSKKIYSFKLEL